MRKVWAWARTMDSESWEGPFKSAAAAERDLRAEAAHEAGVADGPIGYIAEAQYPNVMEFAGNSVDLESLMERMDEMAIDDAFYADDPLFELRDGYSSADAEEALTEVVAKWAKRYLKATQFTIDLDTARKVCAVDLSKERKQ